MKYRFEQDERGAVDYTKDEVVCIYLLYLDAVLLHCAEVAVTGCVEQHFREHACQ